MAEIVLTNVLNKNISVEDLFKWLTADDPQEKILFEIVQNGSTREDFISHFLNYLRNQCKSILPEDKDMQEKRIQKDPIEIRNMEINNSRITTADSSITQSYVNKQEHPNDQKTHPASQASYHSGVSYSMLHHSPIFHGVPDVSRGPRSLGAQNLQCPMQTGDFPPLSHQPIARLSSPNTVHRFPMLNSPGNQHPGSLNAQINQSVANWNHGYIMRHPTQLTSPNQCSTSSNDGNYPAGSSSPHNLSNVNIGQAQTRMSNLNISLTSENFDTSFSNPLMDMSSPSRHENSMINRSSILNSSFASYSPVSPLYANNSSIHCPPKLETSQNYSCKSHDNSSNNVNVSKSSTPKSATRSGEKKVKSVQMQNACLGDSMKTEPARNETNRQRKTRLWKQSQAKNKPNSIQMHSSSKAEGKINESKSSRRIKPIELNDSDTYSGETKAKSGQMQNACLGDFMKNEPTRKETNKQTRTRLSKQSQAEKESKPPRMQSSSKTEGKVNESKSTRRIKPTRLNDSGDKDAQGQDIFGIISRPSTSNPKFVEAPSSDKSHEELSFEVERGLLKLERNRQPRSETKIDVPNIEAKLPSKIKSGSTIVPQLDLVENVETLDTLASIYCGILDRNLMSNPMAELYFLVTLLTTHYKAANENEKNVNVNVNKSSIEILETLKNDLGCTELSDEILTETSEDDSVSCEKQYDKKSFNEDTSQSSNAENTRDDFNDSIEEDKKDSIEFLNTPHNCVYFAALVLLNQQNLLTILDRATLKLLCENQQIAIFQPELQTYLNDIYTAKCSQTNRMKQTDLRNAQTNVCFQIDTDNRETFPSVVAFSLFRKQRDLFYEILKDWEDNRLKSDWSYQRALKNKINLLLSLHTDVVNYCHLAKLFVSQLLVSSGQSGKMEDPMDDESLSFLKSLKDLKPEKLLQLKGRLVTPLTSMGPVPQPTFPGAQEFYKEFILNASNWKFYVILENTFIHEIMQINDAQFTHSEIESAETTVDESTKQDFITCVSSLRLLAKFTSFTLSLPFRSVENSPEWLLSQIQLRGRVVPPLDLQNCLLNALTKGRLSLTVPWIVQYMAMLDPVTLRLPYYVNIGELLYCIYRACNNYDSAKKNDFFISPQTSMLMIFTIGWLFELTNFPRDLYVLWQMNYNAKKSRIFDRTNDSQEKYGNFISMEKDSFKEFIKRNSTVDKLDIIDDRAFYECCPFLTEFKILLISGNAMLGNSNANRHITPVSSQLSQPSFTVKTKSLQLQLEEAFFHGQPSSVRKTVDFVSERVASSCVKYICNTIIPSLKQREMENYIKSKNGQIDLFTRDEDSEDKIETSPNASSEKIGKKARMELMERPMEALAATIKESVKHECSQKIPAMCEAKTITSMESLLSDDAPVSVKEACIAIARRMSIERIEQWVDSHIVQSLFLKNINMELKRLSKEGKEASEKDEKIHHNTNVSSPTEIIEMIRNCMWELLERQNRWAKLSVNSIVNILECFRETVTQRTDLIENWRRSLYAMSVEYCLLLITHRQDLFTIEVQENFLKIWKMNDSHVGDDENMFVRIICPRNIRLITSTSNSSVMMVFAKLLKALLKEDLLNMENLSEQCVALFRQEWPEEILKQLSQCLREVVSDYKCSGAQAEAMRYLLDWIATTCNEMEMYD